MANFPSDGLPHTGGLSGKAHQIVHGAGKELMPLKPVAMPKPKKHVRPTLPPRAPKLDQLPPTDGDYE